MGHEFIGVVEDTGSAVSTVKAGDFVIAPFAYFDNTCEFCREGLHTSCVHGGFFSPTAQAEAVRVPQADGTLVKLPGGEDAALLPSLLTLSAGWDARTRSPRPCSGSAARRPASCSASRSPSMAATPPAEPLTEENRDHDEPF